MAFRCGLKIFSKLSSRCAITRVSELVGGARSFASKKPKKGDEPCPNRTCKKGEKKKKKSFWSIFTGEEELPPKPPLETCRKHVAKRLKEPDPDLSCLGGTPFRTCGTAYVIQKEQTPKGEIVVEPEEKILKKLEAHPELKNVVDPLPVFESVEQRLIALSEKKLHPLYKRYMSMPPRKPPTVTYPKHTYQSRSGPVSDEEVPAHLKMNKDCLNKKNIYYEFKRSEPPRQLLAKMLEMKKNEKSTLEKKKDEDDPPAKPVDVSKVLKIKD